MKKKIKAIVVIGKDNEYLQVCINTTRSKIIRGYIEDAKEYSDMGDTEARDYVNDMYEFHEVEIADFKGE